MKLSIKRSSEIRRTARVQQVEGMFDIPLAERSEVAWEAELPIEDQSWNVGLVVGASGTGKSSLAREAFGEPPTYEWPVETSILDAFPRGQSIRDIVGVLNRVGFSSPPSWLRPYQVLSTGEQFRAHLARTISDPEREISVVDEFTSVVDRTVAQIGSAAVAKAVRARGGRFVAVSCHRDIVEWLQPDWVYDTDRRQFERRSPGSHPAIFLDVRRCTREPWRMFGPHHYLSADLNQTSRCYLATLEGKPVAFVALMTFAHPSYKRAWRIHRIVTLPDYQGVGIGGRLVDYFGSIHRAVDRRMLITTGHPALLRRLSMSRTWRTARAPSIRTGRPGAKKQGMYSTTARITGTYEYVGAASDDPAAACLLEAT